MVRILTCHHFQSQRTGRSEEPVAITVVDEGIVVVGLEHRINIYYLSDISGESKEFHIDSWLSNSRRKLSFGEGEFGTDFSFESKGTTAEPASSKKINQDGELRLSHQFSPVGQLQSMAYNARGNYLVCLESQEALNSARVYFKWDRKSKAMTARIAGLVSPTTNREAEENSLLMIEIPPAPSFSPKATATCELTGNIATLSTDFRISVYVFKMKEGRLKNQYGDFDIVTTVQLFGISPEKSMFSFCWNYIACGEPSKAIVFRILRTEPNLMSIQSKVSATSDIKSDSGNILKLNGLPNIDSIEDHDEKLSACEGKVVFSRKNDSAKVFLATITRANRKTKQPNSFISEEFQDDITMNKSEVIFSSPNIVGGYRVEDILRIHTNKNTDTADNLLRINMIPTRINDKLGGISSVFATSQEAFSYHLPTIRHSFVVREAIYSFTSSMTGCGFDSQFFQALTTTGLETFTTRNLFNALKDTEGFENFRNDCPLIDESPTIMDIRPFIGAKMMACNDHCVCVLTSPAGANTGIASAAVKNQTSEPTRPSSDDTLWSIYVLITPNWEMLSKDIMKEALVHQTSNPDAYFVLISELYLILRTTVVKHPFRENYIKEELKKVSRLIGFEYFRKSSRVPLEENDLNNLIEKGITYLIMAEVEISFLFSPTNANLLKDPQLISGIVKFIDAALPRSLDDVSSQTFSPSLAKQILEFLALNSSKTMVSLVIDTHWLRECNAKRLLEILNNLIASEQYSENECLALILTLVVIHGSDKKARNRVSEVLDKMTQKHLTLKLPWTFLLERRKNQFCLSDLLICLSSANSDIHIHVLSDAVKHNEIAIIDILLSFSQGVNLSSDTEVQKNLGRDLQIILENYFLNKLNGKNRAAISPTLTEENEIRALHTLARTYLSHVSTNTHPVPLKQIILTQPNSKILGTPSNISATTNRTSSGEVGGGAGSTKLDSNWLQFGKIPEFVNCIIPDLQVDLSSRTPDIHSTFPTLECKEYFVRLVSLLGSAYGLTPGLEDLVENILNQQGRPDSPVSICLRLLSESHEKAITTLICNYPTVLMLYAKEMFGKSTRKWKTLVTKLKDKIKTEPDDIDMYTTIIESVYLHLANTLNPTELEHVLDKKDENAKFHAACRRIDLANSFNAKVVAIAEEYLNDSK